MFNHISSKLFYSPQKPQFDKIEETRSATCRICKNLLKLIGAVFFAHLIIISGAIIKDIVKEEFIDAHTNHLNILTLSKQYPNHTYGQINFAHFQNEDRMTCPKSPNRYNSLFDPSYDSNEALPNSSLPEMSDKVAALIYPAHDWNGALRSSSLPKQVCELHHNFRAAIVDTPHQICPELKQIKATFNRPIDLLILGAHSNPSVMQFDTEVNPALKDGE